MKEIEIMIETYAGHYSVPVQNQRSEESSNHEN